MNTSNALSELPKEFAKDIKADKRGTKSFLFSREGFCDLLFRVAEVSTLLKIS
jgi:hypothetical protein